MPTTKWPIGVLILLIITVAMASGLALARADPLPQFRLVLESALITSGSEVAPGLRLTVTNAIIAGERIEARNVQVKIEPLASKTCARQTFLHRCNFVEQLEPGSSFSAEEGIWTIPSIPPAGIAHATLRPNRATLTADPYFFDDGEKSGNVTPVRLGATIVEANADRAAERLTSQSVEEWSFVDARGSSLPVTRAALGDVQVGVSVEQQGHDQAISVIEMSSSEASRGFVTTGAISALFDVQVQVTLNGLELAAEATVPPGTEFHAAAMIWETGTLHAGIDSLIYSEYPCVVYRRVGSHPGQPA